MVLTVAIAVGAAVFALGGLWAWQSWSSRSSEPIDDLLPLLVSSAVDDDRDASDVVVASQAGGTVQAAVPSLPRVGVGATEEERGEAESVKIVEIIVHISGAVVQPGVVNLAEGSRVFEALSLAGGATEDADLDRVNLAAPLVDGERIHVPARGEDVLPTLMAPDRPTSMNSTDSDAAPSTIDINRATATELEALPGIGPSLAQTIVQTREERGPFLAVEELLEVPGIGDAKLALVEQRVTVGP
jgi:competence protein ComEA